MNIDGTYVHPAVLREYALLADRERGALVGPRGEIAWLCAPRWESDAVFAALLGGPGFWAITPTERFVWGGFYEEGSLIWRSRWVTDDGGIAECREALAMPGEPGRAVLLRRIEIIRGSIEFAVVLELGGGFGEEQLSELRRHDDGIWTGRIGPLWVRWSVGDLPVEERDGRLVGRVRLCEGQAHDLVLEIGDRPLPDRLVSSYDAWSTTETAWRAGEPAGCLGTGVPWEVRHSYAVLRGLTSTRGGMVAAATTALPERDEQARDYDYRYAWIRDQCCAGSAAALIGGNELLDQSTRFVSQRLLADGPKLAPVYTAGGDPVPDERLLPLCGYPGGAPRVGNRGGAQFQLDTFGEALLLFAAAAKAGRLDADGRAAVNVAVDAVRKRWREPDAGIWELEERCWAHSRLMCVAGLRAVASCGVTSASEASEWSILADAVLAGTSAQSVHPSGRWQRAPDDERVDASLVLAAVRGAVPANDPRSVTTLAAVLDELTDDGYVYRFRHDERPLPVAEGAFVLTGFATALACHQQGNTVAATRFFERNRAAAGTAALCSEEYDVQQRQLRGNIPQAFCHALLIEAAVRLATPWDHLD